MRLLRGFPYILSTCSMLLGIAMAAVAIQRASLPYNSQGRYFDESSSTVFYEQAVLSYWLIAIALFLIAGVGFLITRHKSK